METSCVLHFEIINVLCSNNHIHLHNIEFILYHFFTLQSVVITMEIGMQNKWPKTNFVAKYFLFVSPMFWIYLTIKTRSHMYFTSVFELFDCVPLNFLHWTIEQSLSGNSFITQATAVVINGCFIIFTIVQLLALECTFILFS